jgi:hypothetical protein
MKPSAWIVVVAAASGCSNHPTEVALPDALPDVFVEVENVGGNCSVTIGDTRPTTQTEDLVGDYAINITVGLTASALPGFTLGLWHDTDGDKGSGDPGTLVDNLQGVEEREASLTLGDSPGCAWICCSSGSSACPTADPCR